MIKNKKVFPKLKKKLKWFLTDESGKITKKDALWLSAWALLLSSVDDLSAGSDSWSASVDAWGGHICDAQAECTATANHASWIVNWHYSSNPAATANIQNASVSHYSHSNHGSWGWC